MWGSFEKENILSTKSIRKHTESETVKAFEENRIVLSFLPFVIMARLSLLLVLPGL